MTIPCKRSMLWLVSLWLLWYQVGASSVCAVLVVLAKEETGFSYYQTHCEHLLCRFLFCKLAETWKLENPTIENDGLSVSLSYSLSDRVSRSNLRYEFFDGEGCKEESNPIQTESTYIHSDLNFQPTSGGSEATLSIHVVPDAVVGSPIYTEIDPWSAQLLFCVRASLYTEGTSASAPIEVNFLETPVRFTIQLSGGIVTVLDEDARR